MDGNGGLKKMAAAKRNDCNTEQGALEMSSCSYATKLEGSCDTYGTCYAAAKKTYDEGISNLLKAQNNRVLEFGLVKRLECYCGLFSAANGGDMKGADITKCKNEQHSTSHLELKPATVPAAPAPCRPLDLRPCNAKYLSAEYGALPSNAQPADCQMCPSAAGEGGGILSLRGRNSYVNMEADQETYIATSGGKTTQVSESVGKIVTCPNDDPDCIYVGYGSNHNGRRVTEWANAATRGRQFGVYNFRNDPQYFAIYPMENAKVTVSQGPATSKSIKHEFDLQKGVLKTFSGNYRGQIVHFESSGDILVSKESNGADYTNLVPASQTVYGSISTYGYIEVFGGETATITQECSDGYKREITGYQFHEMGSAQFTGRACKWTAPVGVLISGHTWADHDGGDGVTYLPSKYFQKNTPIPVEMEFVKLISDKKATCSYSGGKITLSGSEATSVYQHRLVNVKKGDVIKCDLPVQACGDDRSTNDELNLIALNDQA